MIRWLLIDSKGTSIYCDKCGNIANGYMIVRRSIGTFNIPLCKTHGVKIFPELQYAPFIMNYSKPKTALTIQS